MLLCHYPFIYLRVGFKYVYTTKEYAKFEKEMADMNVYIVVFMGITVVEIIFIVADSKKRALHDRMANTLVIKSV